MRLSRTIFQRINSIPMLMSLYVPYFLTSISTSMLLPVLPLYAADFGVAYGMIGLVIGAESVGMMLGDVPAGMFLRRYGTKRMALAGLALVGIASIALYLSTSIAGVILFRLCSGFGLALFGVAQHMVLSTQIPIHWRGRAIALYGGVLRGGGFIGPALGGGIALLFGLRAAFLAFALFNAITLLLVMVSLDDDYQKAKTDDPPHSHRKQLATILKDHWRILTIAGVAQMFALTIRAGRPVIVALYAADVIGLDVGAIGAILSLGTAMDVLMVYPAGMIMDRFGRKRAILPCFTIQAAGMLLVPLTGDALGLLLVTMLMGFGNGLGSGSMMTVGTDLSPVEGRGEFLGVWRLIGDVGISGGPIVVGGVADILTLPAAAAAMAFCGFAATFVFGLFVPETLELRRRKQP